MELQVLIVDDSDIVVFLHTEILALSGLSENPLSAINGQMALQMLSENKKNDPYLILLDINMPVMDGWGFLEGLQNQPDLPPVYVVMVTSSIDMRDKQKATKYPHVIGFFEKPLSMEDCKNVRGLKPIKAFFE
ncbi:response regulator [Parasediminibacterium sp. JCM 36343]|uniref:response regulator n=1 Tax=Parasediminibacterium sp. JCM 36343 TaxID=3374279 RepID=UPI0039794BE9